MTAATGQLGGLVVDELLASTDPGEVAVTVRTPDRASHLADRGVSVRGGDYDDVTALTEALAGTDTLLLISGDAPVEARTVQHRNVVDAAAKAGVTRVVYTSFLDARPGSPFTFSGIHADTEAYLADSGLAWTVLRPSAYAELTLGPAQQARESGSLHAATGDAGVSYLMRHDLARSAAAALTGGSHAGRVYELTGPAAVTQAELAATLSDLGGRPVDITPISVEEYADALRGAGLPDFMVEALAGLQTAIRQDALSRTTDHVERLTGSPATDLRTFLSHALDLS